MSIMIDLEMGNIPINIEMSTIGSGDMLKSVYDTDGDGIVDTCNKVDGGVWEP